MMSLQQAWYNGARWPLLLMPLTALYAMVVAVRRWAYRTGWLKSQRVDVPLIVVGNISVGGTGKSPLVAWLVAHLQDAGWHPGIVSRGYGGQAEQWPQQVSAHSNPQLVGDEPVMLARATGCPVAVAPNRFEAAQSLLAHNVDIIVADDGLQHYALVRDLEIAVRDAGRGYGNEQLLPSGPLREPLSRLQQVDLELENGEQGDFELIIAGVQSLLSEEGAEPLSKFAETTVHAVAGIGHPQRFFDALLLAGLRIIPHAFPDHHKFDAQDIKFNDDYPVLMTAKDAVKCQQFAGQKHYFVPVVAQVKAETVARLDQLIESLPRAAK